MALPFFAAAVGLRSIALPSCRSIWAAVPPPALGRRSAAAAAASGPLLAIAGAGFGATAPAGHGGAARAEALERYVEKDPALPGFELQRPGAGWEFTSQTLQQNTWQDYGRTLKFAQGNSSIEVALQPVGDDKQQLSQLGSPEDFAKAFANSAARSLAPPSTGVPTPVPKVTLLSIKASKDLRRLQAQYRLAVGERDPFIFEQLVGLGTETRSGSSSDAVQKKNYLYSLTAAAPESEFDRKAALFVDVFKSFKFPGQ